MADKNITQQACNGCKRELPSTSFSQNGHGGLRRRCRACCADAWFARSVSGKSAEGIQRAKERREQALYIREYSRLHPEAKWCQRGRHFQPRSMFSTCSGLSQGLQSYCKDCHRQHCAEKSAHYKVKKREYRAGHLDGIKERGAKYYGANKAKILQQCKEYRKRNKWQVRRAMQKAYQRRKDVIIRRSRARYSQQREAILEHCHAYYRAHKQQYKEYSRARASRRRRAAGTYGLAQWKDKLAYWGYRCYLCDVCLQDQSIHLEHRKPLIRGGSNWIANIAPACGRCNRKKHTKTEAEYRALLLGS